MGRIVLTLLIFIYSSLSYAGTYYIDPDATGNGSGTSWANAVSTCTTSCNLGSNNTWYISGGVTSKTFTKQLKIYNNTTVLPGAAEPSPDPNHSGIVTLYAAVSDGIVDIIGDNSSIIGTVNGVRKIIISGMGNTIPYGVYCNRSTGVYTGHLIKGVEFTQFGGAGTGHTGAAIRFYMCQGEVDNVYIHDLNIAVDAGISALYIDSATNYERMVIHDSEIHVLSKLGSGDGADGIQTTGGLTAYNNLITSTPSASFTGNQHADGIQQTGYDYLKLYNNTITGFPNYAFFLERSRNHIQVYNNYLYKTRGPINAFNRGSSGPTEDYHIYNNTIVDCIGSDYPAIFYGYESGVSSGSDIAIRNNIVVNCPSGIQIMSTGTTRYDYGSLQCGTEITVDQNIGGVACRGSVYSQPTYGSTEIPSFVDYVEDAGASNDMHPAAGDTVAKDRGANLASSFDNDIQGISRPQGAAWDIGSYEYDVGTADSTPSAYSFSDVTGADLRVYRNSDNVALAGFDNTTTISISGTGCLYSVNGAAWASANDNVTVGDNVALRGFSSAEYSTTYPSCTLTIGGVSDSGAPWTVTTLAETIISPGVSSVGATFH